MILFIMDFITAKNCPGHFFMYFFIIHVSVSSNFSFILLFPLTPHQVTLILSWKIGRTQTQIGVQSSNNTLNYERRMINQNKNQSDQIWLFELKFCAWNSTKKSGQTEKESYTAAFSAYFVPEDWLMMDRLNDKK